MFTFCFFFSSRRRHTRFDCDWSSDVCSSDLTLESRRHRRGRPHLLWRRDKLADGEERLELPVAVRVSGNLRSEEHTSELQSQSNLVCRLLLEKKKIKPQILYSKPFYHLLSAV